MTEALTLLDPAPTVPAPPPGAPSTAASGAPESDGATADAAEAAGDFAALLADSTGLSGLDSSAPPAPSGADSGALAPAGTPEGGKALPFTGVGLPHELMSAGGRLPRAESPTGSARAAATAATAPAAGVATAAGVPGGAAAAGAFAAVTPDADILQWSAAGSAESASVPVAAGSAEGVLSATTSAAGGGAAAVPTGLAPAMAGYGEVAMRGSGESVPQLQVPVAVTDLDFGGAVGAKVLWQVGQQVRSAQLILNPPALGPVEVRVEMHNDTAHVHFVAQHGMTRDAIEDALPRLRDMLAQAGVQLGDTSVSAQADGGRRSFGSDADGGPSRAGPADDTETPVPGPRLRLGLVDAYV